MFSCPENSFSDPNNESAYHVEIGTSDLAFCNRLIREKIFDAAGWPEFQKKRYPLLVDTRIQVGHIEQDGRMFPLGGIPKQFQKEQASNGRHRPTRKVRRSHV